MTPAREQGELPLSALLSMALVAFTVEFDNAAELNIPHKTTRYGGTRGGVWLVSMAMWLNCMRYVGEDPVTVAKVARLARTGTNLDGMRRWGYLTIEPGEMRSRAGDQVLRATARGLRARSAWDPLTAVIEDRWRTRFGAADIDGLRDPLVSLAGQVGGGLPDCLPILRYGLYTLGPGPRAEYWPDARRDAGRAEDASGLALPWLLARVLLAFAISYERESRVSLAIAANLLRVLDEQGVRVRDLPALTGVSKEAVAMAAGFTAKHDLTVTAPDPGGGRWKVVRLTPTGTRVRGAYLDRLASLEQRWEQRFGPDVIGRLRESLARLAGSGGPDAPLFGGLEPGPGNWRADVAPPRTLPHYPMVLHRGGYPDGS